MPLKIVKRNYIEIKNDLRSLYDLIMNQNIIILKDLFETSYLNNIKNKIIKYRTKIESNNYNRLNSKSSFVRRDVNPIHSITKHTFDSYCISTFDIKNDYLSSLTIDIFDRLKYIHNSITNNTFDYSNIENNVGFRPQIIHYPIGGGHFDYHTHPLLPQEIGLILNLSAPKSDYKSGSTVFKENNTEIDIFDDHQQGCLAIFKYDLMHKVTAVDQGDSINFKKGRFSAILPIL